MLRRLLVQLFMKLLENLRHLKFMRNFMKIKFTRNFWLGFVGGLAFVLLFFVWVFLLGVQAGKHGSFYNQGKNAVWIGHEWAQVPKTDNQIFGLVDELQSHDIDTIYLHTGPLGYDGSIAPEIYAETVNFVSKVQYYDPDMKVYSWLGQLRHKIDLADPAVRHRILNMCVIFTGMIGMDGVHYDIEPVWDEDEDFILLLRETREEFDRLGAADGGSKERLISVALSEFIPHSFIWWTEQVAGFENYNTEENYLNVAQYADQIVGMVYDTGIDQSYLYKWLVKEQVIWVTNLLAEASGDEIAGVAGTEFLIGIPSYDDENEGFDPEVENIGTALTGVIRGLDDIRSEEGFFTGVAVYSQWETDEVEWRVYDSLWK